MDERISLYKLRVFCRVVELSSVTRAGEELWLAQPVVSGHLRSLQDRVGERLVYWEGRDLRLTEIGRVFYGWARRVLDEGEQIDRLIAASRVGSLGRVTVGTNSTPGTYVIPPLLVVAHDLFPHLELSVEIFESTRVETALIEGRCDVVVMLSSHYQLNEQIDWVRLRGEDMLLVAAPSRELPNAPLARIDELPFICAPHGHPRRQALDRLLRTRGIDRRRVMLELSHQESIRAAVVNGAGVAFLFRSVVQADLASGTLQEIELGGATRSLSLSLPLFAGRPRGRALTEPQQQIYKFLVEELADPTAV